MQSVVGWQKEIITMLLLCCGYGAEGVLLFVILLARCLNDFCWWRVNDFCWWRVLLGANVQAQPHFFSGLSRGECPCYRPPKVSSRHFSDTT
jgi:hypothetical protein